MNNTPTHTSNYILTFGYGNRKDYQEFIEYLEQYKVAYVIDVRIRPRAWSRKWYGDGVEKLCLSKGIKYTAYLVLVKYILTGRDAHPTRLSEYSFVPHLAAKGCISKSALGNTSGNAKWEPPDKQEAEKSLQEVAEIAFDGTVLLRFFIHTLPNLISNNFCRDRTHFL